MSLRINHNIMAINAVRNLYLTDIAFTKSLEKLSSGRRINRAADDAAGLAISEKMRSQINGLSQAVRNSQDGVSLIQTAEGAMGNVQSILQRMRELAVQAASDGITDADRRQVQEEVDQLAKQITHIANTTQFNTRRLLNGGLGSGVTDLFIQMGANKGEGIRVNIGAVDATSLGVSRDILPTATVNPDNTAGITGASVTGRTGAALLEGEILITVERYVESPAVAARGTIDDILTLTAKTAGAAGNSIVVEFVNNGPGGALSVSTSGNRITVELATDVNGAIISTWSEVASAINGDTNASALVNADAGSDTSTLAKTGTVYLSGGADEVQKLSYTAVLDSTTEIVTGVALDATSVDFTSAFAGLTLTKNAAYQDAGFATVALTAGHFSTSATFDAFGNLISDAVAVGGVSVMTQADASDAITLIDAAINTVSGYRARLGAVQNRLEHTISNLQITSENLSAAESRIRDVDMAQEMMDFTRNQILQQAGIAMLAQANAAPQTILSLIWQ